MQQEENNLLKPNKPVSNLQVDAAPEISDRDN